MKKSLLFLLISLPFFLAAQNYQNICSPGITFFKDNNENLKAFRQDTVVAQSNGDTLFISYTTIRDSIPNGNCRDVINGDALGRKIIKKHDGWVCFFNKKNDTIKINTLASLNETWKYCKLPDNRYIEAKVTEIRTDSLLGLTDQVKIISFQSKDAANNNITGLFNQKHIKLSQHYGLSEIYDIYWTPADTIHYILAGKTNPAIGVQPFIWQDVYNFDVGDEFHYKGFWEGLYLHSLGPSWSIINKILEKTVYGIYDSVAYKIEFCKNEWFPTPPPNIWTSYDTVNVTYNFDRLANNLTPQRLPDEFHGYTPGTSYAPSYARMISDCHGRPVQIFCVYYYLYNSSTHCYSPDNVYYYYHYAPGLGECTYSFWNWVDSFHEEQDLVYYKKGTETWGTPVATDCNALVPVPSMTAAQKTVVRIIPNPIETNGTIIVENYFPGDPLQLIIYDFVGRKVAEIIIKSASTELPNENLSSGLYFFTLSGRSGSIIEKGKILIR